MSCASVPASHQGGQRSMKSAVTLSRGKVFHDDIGAASPVLGELALGWVFHYVVGVLYGIVCALIVGANWFAGPVFWQVWIWGILTIAGGWFVLHPGMGLGWAGRPPGRRPRGRRGPLGWWRIRSLRWGCGARHWRGKAGMAVHRASRCRVGRGLPRRLPGFNHLASTWSHAQLSPPKGSRRTRLFHRLPCSEAQCIVDR